MTMRLSRISSGQADPPKHVFFVGRWLKMRRVTAPLIPAKVIQRQIVRYGTDKNLVGEPVGLERFGLAEDRSANADVTVFVGFMWQNPTSALVSKLREVVREWLSSQHRALYNSNAAIATARIL